MKFIQLTDLHIPPEGEKPLDLDIRGNFLKLIDKVKKHQPDFFVVTGDLCYLDGQVPIYDWIKEQLDKMEVPYYVIPGNHDDSSMLAKQFGIVPWLQDGTLFFEANIEGNPPLLFTDTAAKTLSVSQLNWLKKQIHQKEGPLFLFIHHPVLESGTPFMDKSHALENKEEVREILVGYPGQVFVFSGHFHIEKTIIHKNIIQHITPSCYLQISQWSNEFEIDHFRVAFREVVFQNQSLRSTVVYL